MAVKISHAKYNELGTVTGGQAGDQMQGSTLPSNPSLGALEVVTEAWYNSSSNPWTGVLRHPNANFANKVAAFAAALAANENVGYGQDYRDTLRYQLNLHSWNLAEIDPCMCDCSSFVRCCCIYAGTDPGDFYTGNEVSALTAIGFSYLTTATLLNSPDDLHAGDILIKSGHTAVVSTVTSEGVWMYWTFYESGYPYNSPQALSIMGGVGNGGYGQFGFHYMYGLVPFMQFCVNHSTVYSGFQPYIDLGQGNSQLANNAGLHDLFISYANNYTQDFAWCQSAVFVQDYLQPVVSAAQAAGVLNLDNPYVLGTLGSFAIRSGVQGANTVAAINAMAGISNVTTELLAGYQVFINNMDTVDAGRWTQQSASCIADMINGANVYDLDTFTPVPPSPTPGRRRKGLPIWMMVRRIR